MRPENKTMPSGSLHASKALFAPLITVAVLILSIGSRYIDRSIIGYDTQQYLSLVIMQLMIFVLPAVFYAKTSDMGYALRLKLGFIAPTRIWFAVTALFTLISGSAVIRLASSYMGYSESLFGDYSTAATVSSGSVTDVLYIIVTFAVIPAITEEFCFRAVILTEYREGGYGVVTAVMMTSLMSAMTRFSPRTLFMFTFCGVMYCMIVYITKSALAAMLCHTLYNIFMLFFEKYLLRMVTEKEYMTLVAFIFVSLFLLSAIFMLGEAERIYHNEGILGEDKTQEPEKIKVLKKAGIALISPTFIICAAIYIVGSIIK